MRLRSIAITTSLALLLQGGDSFAYCTEGPLEDSPSPGNPLSWYVLRDIPVYLIYHPDGHFAGWDRYVVGHQLEVAIDNWYEESGGDFRPYFAGYAVEGTSGLPVGVYVRGESSDCSVCDQQPGTWACEDTNWFLGHRWGSTIWIEYLTCANGISSPKDFLNVFTHELGHAFGPEDEYDYPEGNYLCEGTAWMSTMAGNCGYNYKISRRDIGAIWYTLNTRDRDWSYRESVDAGLTWNTGAPAEPADIAYLRLGSRGSPLTGQQVHAIARYGMTNAGIVKNNPGSTPVFTARTTKSWDVASAAAKNYISYGLAYRDQETDLDCHKRVFVHLTTNNGSSWFQGYIQHLGQPVTSWGEGVALAYDPLSTKYVAIWTNDDDVLSSVTVNSDSPFTQAPAVFYTSPLKNSPDFPAIACSSVIAPPNCMVAWLSFDAYNEIRYQRFFVNGSGGLQPSGPQSTHFYVGWQSPSLVATSVAAYPFVIVVKQGKTLYTWRYQMSTWTWVDERTAATAPKALLSGSLVNIGTEIHVKYVSE